MAEEEREITVEEMKALVDWNVRNKMHFYSKNQTEYVKAHLTKVLWDESAARKRMEEFYERRNW